MTARSAAHSPKALRPDRPVPVRDRKAPAMNNIVYIVGAIVIVLVVLSFLGLR